MSDETDPVWSVESVASESLVLSVDGEPDALELSVVAVLSSSPLPSVPPNLSSSLTSPEPSTVVTGNKTKIKRFYFGTVTLTKQ